jgi:hypothetical protein
MYLPVYLSRDSSHLSEVVPSPVLCYSLTHAHRSIGYHNHNPQSLSESVVHTERLMYLRVYDSRDSSCKPVPSLSVCDSLTHAHSTLPTTSTILTIFSRSCSQVLWFLACLVRTAASCCVTTRARLTVHLQPSVCEACEAFKSDPSVLVCSLSLYRHPSQIYILVRSRFTSYYKRKSSTSLMYLSVYKSRDIASESAPSPSPRSSLTYVHRCIGYRNPTNRHFMTTSVRLMYLSVSRYDEPLLGLVSPTRIDHTNIKSRICRVSSSS